MLLLLAISASATRAAEWKIDPAVSLRAGYNDNIRIRTEDKVSSPEVVLTPSAVFSVRTPTSGSSGTARFKFRRYTQESNLNDDNIYLLTHSFHRRERSELGLDLDFIRDTTLDSQLEETGVVLDRVKRRKYRAGPSWSWSYDERTNLNLGYSYSKVKYDDTGDSGFVDFHTNTFSSSVSRILNERTTGTISLSYTSTSNDNKVDTTNINLQGGGTYLVSETLSASLFGGVRRTEADFSQNSLIPIFSDGVIIGFVPVSRDKSVSDWGYTYRGSIDKRFLRGETGFSASRNINNGINGTPIQVTRFGIRNLYRISETWTTNLNLAYYESETTNAAGEKQGRKYYQIEPRLNWHFRQFWRLSGSYRYRKQTFNNSGDDAIQNAAYLTLTYLWPRIAVSR